MSETMTPAKAYLSVIYKTQIVSTIPCHLTYRQTYSLATYPHDPPLHCRMSSTALGSNIGESTRVSVVPCTTSFPRISRKPWDSGNSELVGTELQVAIQGLQAPVKATDYSLLQPGKYSITHEQEDGSSRFKVTSQAPGGLTGWISASDSKSRDPAYFIVTHLAGTSKQAHMPPLSAGSEAILEVRDNYMGFDVTPVSGESMYCHHVEGGITRSKLSKSWYTKA